MGENPAANVPFTGECFYGKAKLFAKFSGGVFQIIVWAFLLPVDFNSFADGKLLGGLGQARPCLFHSIFCNLLAGSYRHFLQHRNNGVFQNQKCICFFLPPGNFYWRQFIYQQWSGDAISLDQKIYYPLQIDKSEDRQCGFRKGSVGEPTAPLWGRWRVKEVWKINN